MTPRNRNIALFGVLATLAVLVVLDRQNENKAGEIVGAVVRPSAPVAASAPTTNFSTGVADSVQALFARDDYKAGAPNMFALLTNPAKIAQDAAQQAVSAPIPPAPPTAPALPFATIGKQQIGQTWEVFLAKSDQTFVVHEGDMLTNLYQVVSIKPPTMQLRYIPLNQTQTLMIGSSFDD